MVRWGSDAPLDSWMGVTIDENGQVIRLELKRKDLKGGGIPPELGNLANLETLDLARNELNGGIPPELGNLVNLETLDLGRSGLRGEIPLELGNLVNLTFLDLSGNMLGGGPPGGGIPPEMGNLANLETLDLGHNGLHLSGKFRRNWATSPT